MNAAALPFELHQLIFIGLWLGTCAYAGVGGGWPERIVAAALLIAAPLTRLVQSLLVVQLYQTVELGVLLVDTALLAVLLAVAMWSTRYWPLLMTSMQGTEVLGHLAKLIAPDTLPRAYFFVVAMWSVPMLVLLALGTLRHRGRLRRYGIDPAWVHQLPQTYREGASAT